MLIILLTRLVGCVQVPFVLTKLLTAYGLLKTTCIGTNITAIGVYTCTILSNYQPSVQPQTAVIATHPIEHTPSIGKKGCAPVDICVCMEGVCTYGNCVPMEFQRWPEGEEGLGVLGPHSPGNGATFPHLQFTKLSAITTVQRDYNMRSII